MGSIFQKQNFNKTVIFNLFINEHYLIAMS